MAKSETSSTSGPRQVLGVPEFAKVPGHSWIRPWTDAALISVFAAILLLPLIVSLFGGTADESLGENRRLATMPPLAAEPYAKWPGIFENYYRDKFGLRNSLVHANNVVLRLWLGVSSEKLVIGKDRWAFYRSTGERNLENHLGLDPLTAQQLEFWKQYLERQQSVRTSLNIKSLFVIAPDKESVYPEMLPAHLSRRGRTRVDQLLDYLRQTQSTANVLDLRPVPVAAKRDGLVYFPQDTHWNGRGYFAAYRAISQRLREWFPDLAVQDMGKTLSIQRVASSDGDWGLVGLPEQNRQFPYEVLLRGWPRLGRRTLQAAIGCCSSTIRL